jgi:hypothetical protein
MVNQFQHVTNYIADFEKAGLVYIQRRRRQGGRREQADAEKSLGPGWQRPELNNLDNLRRLPTTLII